MGARPDLPRPSTTFHTCSEEPVLNFGRHCACKQDNRVFNGEEQSRVEASRPGKYGAPRHVRCMADGAPLLWDVIVGAECER